jgi:glyoxalase family protein
MAILGIHHIALVSSDAERLTDYLTRVLGLRLLATEPGADDGANGRLYFGNDAGTPGSILSVAEQRDARPGHEGVGGTHHYALLVETRDALLQWKRWLADNGIAVSGPFDRHYFESIYHRDPDGQVVEIATRGHGWTRDEEPERIGTEQRVPPAEMVKGNRDAERIRQETWPEPIEGITPAMRFQKMHHITAIGRDIEQLHRFLHDALGMRLVKRTSNFDMPDSYHWYWGVGDGEPGTVVTYFERKDASAVHPGPGQASHYALSVADEDALREMAERLRAAGYEVSDVEDRTYFKSVSTHDPDGQRVEIATIGPGFAGAATEEPA